VSGDRRALLLGVALLAALSVYVAVRVDVATDITHFLPRGGRRAAGSG